MAKITIGGKPINTIGDLPAKGADAPSFTLVNADLSTASLDDFRGKKVLLNIFPSLETSVCATSLRKFNEKASGMENTTVIAISKDLPFSFKRFCSTEGIEKLVTLSAFRDLSFGKEYGVTLLDGPFEGLLARSIVIIDEKGKVIYTELVPEIAQEPDYEAALAQL